MQFLGDFSQVIKSESEINKILASCSSQLRVFYSSIDCLMSMSCHSMQKQGIFLIPTFSQLHNYRLNISVLKYKYHNLN